MADRFDRVQQIVLLALVLFLTVFFRTQYVFEPDHGDIISWSEGFVARGLANAYEVARFNYGAAAVYILYGFGILVGGRMAVFHLLLRQFFFLFDLGAIFLLMRYLERNGQNAVRALFVLFNLAFLYNSLLWGQMDGVFTALIFGCILAGLAGQPELAAALFVLAFGIKPQPIIYLPLVGLLLIPCLVRQPLRLATTLAAGAATQLILILPFIQNGAWRDWLAAYSANTNLFPLVSMNAHNFWYLVLPGDPIKITDTTTFLSVTYKTWGILMFALFGVLTLVPLVIRVGVRTLQREEYNGGDGELVLLAAGVLTVGFFFLNTEMHERYAYPAVLFLGAYAVMARDYFLYILVSVAHILNINAVFRLMGMQIPLVQRLATPELVAALFLIAVLVGLVQLYRTRGLSDDVQVILGAVRDWRAKGALASAMTP